MTALPTRVSSRWLALRESADAAARAHELVENVRRTLPSNSPLVIHDIGCGTGAMGRWLAPQLPGRQHWVAHDRDEELLALAATHVPAAAADGSAVTVEPKLTDIAQLRACDLADASLITGSALLDLLTEEEMARLAGRCAGAGCPVLLTLSVVGRVEIIPPDPLDADVASAFDAHQRRTTERGRLLGPDAIAFALEEFGRHGAEVLVRPSPWRLGPSHANLTAEWFSGWVGAACEQQVELATECELYARRRLSQATAGRLAVTVDHADLLVLP